MRLDKAHKSIKKDRIINDVMRRCEHQVIGRVQANSLACAVLVLHDKFGFGKKRLQEYMSYLYDYYDSMYGKWLDFDDIRKCVYDELQIDFDEIEEMLADRQYKRLNGGRD